MDKKQNKNTSDKNKLNGAYKIQDQTSITRLISETTEFRSTLPNPENIETSCENCKTILWVKLKPDISKVNFFAFLMFNFNLMAGIVFTSNFTILILKDPDYYNISTKVLAEELGNISMIGNLI